MYQYHTPVLDYNGGPPATTRALTTQSVMKGTYPEEYREEPFVDPRSRALAVYVDREKDGPIRFTGRQPWKEYGLQRVFAESRYNLNYQLQPTWICCGREKGEPGCWKSDTRGEIQAYNVIPEIRQLRGAVPDEDRFVELWDATKMGTPWVDYKYYERLHNQMQEIKADRSLALYVRAYLFDYDFRLDAEKNKLSNLARLYSLELEYNEVHGRYRPLTLRGGEKWLSFIEADLRPVRESIHKRKTPAPIPSPAPVPKEKEELEPTLREDDNEDYNRPANSNDDTIVLKKGSGRKTPPDTPVTKFTKTLSTRRLPTDWTFAEKNVQNLFDSIEKEEYPLLKEFNNILDYNKPETDFMVEMWEKAEKEFDPQVNALFKYLVLKVDKFSDLSDEKKAIFRKVNTQEVLKTYVKLMISLVFDKIPKGPTLVSLQDKYPDDEEYDISFLKNMRKDVESVLDEFEKQKKFTEVTKIVTEDELHQFFIEKIREKSEKRLKDINSEEVRKEFEKRLEQVKTMSDYQKLRMWLITKKKMVPKEKEEIVQPNPLHMKASTFEEVRVELTNLIKTNGALKKQLYDLWQPIIDGEMETQKMSDLNLWNNIQNLSNLTLLQKQYLQFKLVQYMKDFPIGFKTKWDSIKKAMKNIKKSTREL